MTADEFRNDVALMLERLGHTVINAHGDIVTTKAGQKFIVACAVPADKEVKTPALRRLHDTVVSTGATRGIYVTPRAFTPAAEHYAASAPIDLVDGALLIKSMHHSRKGLNCRPATKRCAASAATSFSTSSTRPNPCPAATAILSSRRSPAPCLYRSGRNRPISRQRPTNRNRPT